MSLIGFPLLLIPFAIYNIIAFLMPGVGWTGPLTTVHMVSGGDWSMSAGDMLVGLAILLLSGEVMKSTRIGIRTVIDHALSDPVPRHAGRVPAGQADRDRHLLPAPGHQLRRRARRFCGDAAFGPARSHDRRHSARLVLI